MRKFIKIDTTGELSPQYAFYLLNFFRYGQVMLYYK